MNQERAHVKRIADVIRTECVGSNFGRQFQWHQTKQLDASGFLGKMKQK